MNGGRDSEMDLERIVELGRITGDINDATFRALLRRLSVFPDPGLAEMLLRRLTLKAHDKAFDPPPFNSITEDLMDI